MHLPIIYRSTAVVALGVLALLILMNVPGEGTYPTGFGCSANGSVRYEAEYEHGWPWVFLYRSFEYPYPIVAKVGSPLAPKYGIPWLAWPSWEFWHGEVWNIRFGAVLLNLVTGSLLILATAGAWEWRRRRRRLLQFNLAEFLAMFVIVAAPLGWWWHAKDALAREAAAAVALGGSTQCYEDYYGPLWLKRLIGEDFALTLFSRVDSVTLDTIDGDKFEQAMPSLRAFPYLGELEINVDPDAKTPIRFSRLAQLKGLRSLVLDEIVLTDQDVVDELALVPQLEEIAITNWRGQDPATIQRLMGALPNCIISEDRIAKVSDAL
jgi:hypothetical protein